MTKSEYIKKLHEFEGVPEGTPKHKIIIDTYNKIKPLPVGYKVNYDDPWCAAFISSIAFMLNATDFPYECSAERMRKLSKPIDEPVVGAIAFFKKGRAKSASHVGVIIEVTGNTFKTIEGNKLDKVSICNYKTGDSCILSYGMPKYDSPKSDIKPDLEIAKEVIQGKWDVGEERRKMLKRAGYDPDVVQKLVNKLMK